MMDMSLRRACGDYGYELATWQRFLQAFTMFFWLYGCSVGRLLLPMAQLRRDAAIKGVFIRRDAAIKGVFIRGEKTLTDAGLC
jgi:hypothetical protein